MLYLIGADKHVQAQDGTPFALARKVDPNIFAVLCDADGMSTSRREYDRDSDCFLSIFLGRERRKKDDVGSDCILC